jgi:hypothetical protein
MGNGTSQVEVPGSMVMMNMMEIPVIRTLFLLRTPIRLIS